MESDVLQLQDQRLVSLRDSLVRLGHVDSSGHGCANWILYPASELIIARMIVDVGRLKYDDPGGANTKLVETVGEAMGLNLFSPFSPEDYFDGHVELQVVRKRRRLPDAEQHLVGLSRNLLVDARLGASNGIQHVILSQPMLEWHELSLRLGLAPGEHTDAKSVLASSLFIQKTWLRAYLDADQFEVTKAVGEAFWPIPATFCPVIDKADA